MKPTQPMNAYPPGGPPGTPPGGGGYPPGPPGGSYPGGPPPGGYGTPPPGGFPQPQQPPPKKSRTGLLVGLGCGCLALVGCLVGGGVYYAINQMGPGEEVVSTNITPGTPFSLSYIQSGSQKYAAWLEVDLDHPSSYSLNGTILLSENDSAFGQYTMSDTGSGAAITERSSSTRINWTSTSSSTSGTVSLFPIPARTAGSTCSLSGTINAPTGTTGTIRLIVAKRD